MNKHFTGNIRAAVSMLDPAQRRRWALTVPLGVVGALVESAAAACIFALVAILSSEVRAADLPVAGSLLPWLPLAWQSEKALLTLFLCITIVVFAVRVFLYLAVTLYRERIIAGDQAALTRKLYTGYLSAPYAFHIQRNVDDYSFRIVTAATHVFSTVLGGAATIVTNALSALALVGVVLFVNPVLALASVVFVALWVGGVQRALGGRLARISAELDQYRRLQHRVMMQGLSVLREIKVSGRERWFERAYAAHSEEVVEWHWRSALTSLVPRITLESMFLGGILFLSATLVSASGPPGDLLPVIGLYAYVGMRLLPIINAVLAAVNSIVATTASVEHLLSDWHAVLPYVEEAHADVPPMRFDSKIELDRVSFRYAGTDVDVLRDLSVTIEKGDTLGVVGSTGAGKSTLAHLLLGLLRPTTGTLSIDGANLVGAERAWRQHVGFVPQSISVIDDTVRANVALGVDPTEVADAHVWRVLETAQLAEAVRALPDGLDTTLGDRGIRLSGGQRQRIAIARAIYHDPDVLVFDEATASLDSVTEREVTGAIAELGRNRTTIVVAHRISTVRQCDRILVLGDGRMLGSGSYDELLAESPAFQALASVAGVTIRSHD